MKFKISSLATKAALAAMAVAGVSAHAADFTTASYNVDQNFDPTWNNQKAVDIAANAGLNEVRFASLKFILENWDSMSVEDRKRNLNNPDLKILAEGQNFNLYNQNSGSLVGAGVSAEPAVRIGSGSTYEYTGNLVPTLHRTENITINDTIYTFSGADTTGLVSIGTEGEERAIVNVAAGRIAESSTDAINGSQLYAVVKAVEDGAFSVAAEDSTGKATGKIEKVGFGDTLKIAAGDTNIKTSVADGKVKVALNDVVQVNTSVGVGTNGPKLTATGADLANQKITNLAAGVADTDGVNVKQLKDVKTVADNAAAAAAANKTAIDKGLKVGGDEGTAKKFALGDTVSVNGDGTNIKTVATDAGVKVTLKDDVRVASSVGVGENGPKLTTAGIDGANKKITGVAAGEADTDAVNVSQLKPVKEAADAAKAKADEAKTAADAAKATADANKAKIEEGLKVGADSGEAKKFNLGDTVAVNGDGSNIKTSVTETGVKVALADDVRVAGSIGVGENGPKLTATGADLGGQKITNLAAGEADTDGVNVKQLKDAVAGIEGVKNAVTYTDDTHTAVQLGKDGNPAKLSGVKAGEADTDAVNVSQLKPVKEAAEAAKTTADAAKAAVEKGLKFGADSGEAKKFALGDTVAVNGDGSNIKTSVTETGVKVALADDVRVASSIGVGENGPKLTVDGIDAAGKRISGVADGVADNDAVNVGQLKRSIGDFDTKINDVDKKAKQGVAAALATAALGQAWEAGADVVSVAGSTYGGQAAWAVGGSNITDNGRWLLKYSVSGSKGSRYGAAGSVTYSY